MGRKMRKRQECRNTISEVRHSPNGVSRRVFDCSCSKNSRGEIATCGHPAGCTDQRNTRVNSTHGRPIVLIGTLSLILLAMVAPSINRADAAEPLPETVTADALPTAQMNGKSTTVLIVGDTVYAGGDFTSARPAGAPAGTGESQRWNAMAFDLRTGALKAWAPQFNGQVKDIATNPAKTKLYVVGTFTQVNGLSRNRIAIFDLPSGNLSSLAPNINGITSTVAATNDTIFVGGYFTGVNNLPRGRAAAINASTGATLPWRVDADNNQVQSMEVNTGVNKVLMTGNFTSVGGSDNPGYGMFLSDATTGEARPLPVNTQVRDAGENSGIAKTDSDGQRFYGVGWHYGGGGNSEGTFAANWSDGSLVWIEDCHGDTYDVAATSDVVYTASHKHYCGNSNGFPQSDPWTYYHSNAFSNDVRGTNTPDIYGYKDHPGAPRPELLNWWPTSSVGSVSGQATWAVDAEDDYVVFAGEFPRVNGQAQAGLVRYAKRSVAGNPKKRGPQNSAAAINPSVRSARPGEVRLTWPANRDQDSAKLTYRIYRNTVNAAGLVHEEVQTARWWEGKPMSFRDTGLTPGADVRYQLRVLDDDGNLATSNWVTVTVAATDTLGQYGNAVFDDGATKYWRLGDSGTAVADWIGSDNTVAGSGVTRGTAGALNNWTDTASGFAGTANGRVISSELTPGPHVFSTEVWFKTTSRAGGKIVGFGNAATGDSGSYDRHIMMNTAGRLVFGVYPSAERAVTSAKAYNDGQWHQAVATLSPKGQVLYVDGKRVAQRTDTTSAQVYNGYWRIGGDNTWTGGKNFNGQIDEFSVYPTALTPAQVNNHWIQSGRPSALGTAPADPYGASVFSDEPDLFWRLADTGSTAADAAPLGDREGTIAGNRTAGRPGVIAGNASLRLGPSTMFGMSPGGVVTSKTQIPGPATFSQEVWFKTTMSGVGRIFGFGSSSGTGASTNYDRHLWLSAGRLNFGVNPGSAVTITSSETLNDGQWHHVVSTLGPDGMKLYVDGELDGTHPNTSAQAYDGYWKLGGDRQWTDSSTAWFDGDVDEAAIYSRALSTSDVQRHFVAGGGVLPNVSPTADFTVAKDGLAAAFTSNASDRDGTIVSYLWDFGDGQTSTQANPSHTYDEEGTFTVTLTVADEDGGEGTYSAPVVMERPNVAPTADFRSTTTPGSKTVAFTSEARDSDGSIVSHLWEFGDGNTSTEQNPVHDFVGFGSHEVKLTVTDDEGASSSVTRTVSLEAPNQPPTAAFSVTTNGLRVTVNAAGSSDPDGTITSYEWDFDEGPGGSGSSATHTYGAAGTYTIALTVTDDDGGTHTATREVTVSVPAATDIVAKDVFDRTVTGGWGAADVGGAWSTPASAQRYSVSGGAGVLSVPAGGTVAATLGEVGSANTRVTGVFSVDKLFEATYVSLVGRKVGTNEYFARLRLAADGSVRMNLLRNPGTVTVGAQVVPNLTIVPGEKYRLAIEVTGSGPTTLKAKVWKDGTAEPDWQRTVTDVAAALQVPGSVGVWGTLPSAASAVSPLALRWDAITVTDPTIVVAEPEEPPTPNVAPVADFAWTASGLTAAFTSAASDSDGTIASHAWDFGDGATSTASNPSHRFDSPGSYVVRLTVTDDDGATHSVTKSLAVSAPDPEDPAPANLLAEDVFDRTVTGGWGAADVGGAWSTPASAQRYSVSGGAGVLSVPAGGTVAATLGEVGSANTRVTGVFSVDKLFEATYVSLVGRKVGTNEYFARLRLAADGSVRMNLLRNPGTVTVGAQVVPNLTIVPGEKYRLAIEVTGSGPTTLKAKVWKDGTAEPDWQRTVTDAAAALQVPGSVGVWGTLPSAASAVSPLALRWDAITVTDPSALD
ncbi:PKD domain-containing protein [Aeromicrobium senzhongii]|uniref:PKD domain-containing protein n=1 Tax=Aeromicrobium senzhongii TaxID=2663859 RepID=A0ABX6SU97_9ACTN|nr:PKD domain-containing protein [Aeromicrobium senzhongii]MTB88002.1 PKD domain-containing protein [Aeromicrobium senzhongii]QNL94988.1 PKD domain-containing protein [Aeromicrobium senzhongii]